MPQVFLPSKSTSLGHFNSGIYLTLGFDCPADRDRTQKREQAQPLLFFDCWMEYHCESKRCAWRGFPFPPEPASSGGLAISDDQSEFRRPLRSQQSARAHWWNQFLQNNGSRESQGPLKRFVEVVYSYANILTDAAVKNKRTADSAVLFVSEYILYFLGVFTLIVLGLAASALGIRSVRMPLSICASALDESSISVSVTVRKNLPLGRSCRI